MTTTKTDGLSFDMILFYASQPCGMDDDTASTVTRRRIAALASEGAIELRERTVEVPAVDMPESCKAVAMFDTWSARTVTLRTWHLKAAERAA